MKRSITTVVAALGLSFGVLSTCASTDYWDDNGDTAGFGAAGGTWGTEPKWSADNTGASVPAVTDTTDSDDLHFGTAANGLESGTITVSGASQAFRSMTFGAASGAITLTGGTLNLASPVSSIVGFNASNTIASVLAGTNGLSSASSDALIYTGFLTFSSTTLFPTATLSNFVGIKALMDGGYIGGPTAATPCFYTNNGTTATVQMQIYNGGFTKCVKIELTQSGPDIAGRALYAKYHPSGANVIGFDFDTGGEGNSLATSPGDAGYGVSQTSLSAPYVLTLAGVNTYSGDTTIGSGTLEIGGAGQLGSGSYAGAIINSGQLLYNSSASQLLSGPLSGTGTLVKRSPGKTVSTKTYASYLTSNPTVILLNTSLSDCVGASGKVGGAYVNNSPCPAAAYHFKHEGATVTFQLQILNDVYTKCVKVELTQTGTDLFARAVYAKYVDGSQLGFDFDAGGNIGTIATSPSSGGYGAAETTLDISLYSKLTLSGSNSYSGGTVVNRGVLEASETASSLPSTGAITVNNDGELVLKVGSMNVGNPGGVGNGNPITVNSGGTLTFAAIFNAGYSRLITVNGGTLNSTVTENNDCANYVNNLTLQNGARVTGYRLRLGYLSSASIKVSGTSESSVAAGLNLVKNGDQTLSLDVADVTGNAAPDLSIPGVIRDYNGDFAGLPILKTGAGTVSLSGANTHTGPIILTAGTLALGADNTLNTGNPITLSGGTLDMGAFSNEVGSLTVASASAIALGSGRLAFADSSGTTWANTLNLTGTLDSQTVRVGTNENALTSVQLAAIKLNGGRVRIKSDGYLAPALKGMLISIQ